MVASVHASHDKGISALLMTGLSLLLVTLSIAARFHGRVGRIGIFDYALSAEQIAEY